MARAICIDVDDGVCRARLGASWGTVAKVTFINFSADGIIIDRAKGAGNRADFAADAFSITDNFRARLCIHCNRRYRAYLHTPGVSALGTGIGHEPPFIVEIEKL